jgi:hypothetical protein
MYTRGLLSNCVSESEGTVCFRALSCSTSRGDLVFQGLLFCVSGHASLVRVSRKSEDSVTCNAGSAREQYTGMLEGGVKGTDVRGCGITNGDQAPQTHISSYLDATGKTVSDEIVVEKGTRTGKGASAAGHNRSSHATRNRLYTGMVTRYKCDAVLSRPARLTEHATTHPSRQPASPSPCASTLRRP